MQRLFLPDHTRYMSAAHVQICRLARAEKRAEEMARRDETCAAAYASCRFSAAGVTC